MARGRNRTPRRDKRFFEALTHGFGVTEAANRAGYSRRSAYDYRNKYPDFADQWEEAVQTHIESMELEADRRALEGVEESVFYKGTECGRVRRFSDNLLMFRLKALAPNKYRERQEVKHAGEIKNTAPVVNLSFTGPETTDD